MIYSLLLIQGLIQSSGIQDHKVIFLLFLSPWPLLSLVVVAIVVTSIGSQSGTECKVSPCRCHFLRLPGSSPKDEPESLPMGGLPTEPLASCPVASPSHSCHGDNVTLPLRHSAAPHCSSCPRVRTCGVRNEVWPGRLQKAQCCGCSNQPVHISAFQIP